MLPMLTRRALFLTSAVAAATMTATSIAQAQSAAAATSLVTNLGSQMVAIINASASLEQKKRQMQPVIESSVDVDGIARFCLGRFWRLATPEQQAQYVQQFHTMLLNNITGKLGEYQGVTFALTTTTQREGEVLVGTLIHRPNQQPNNVQWVVSQVSGKPMIADVIAEGTSLRLTERADFASFLSRNGNNVQALIVAMQRMGAQG